MKVRKTKKFWKTLFGDLAIGDEVRIINEKPIIHFWIKVEGRKGKIISFKKDRWGGYYTVHFLKKDNPLQLEDFSSTFRREELELIG